ncbi:MAG TPA: ion channel [Pyrinomonadaceae bacterium]|nr:ion channel [Pyrinomonadaceae bacterium]
MPPSSNRDYLKLPRIGLQIVSVFLIVVSLFLFRLGWNKYREGDFMESQLNTLKSGDHWFLAGLFLLPIVILIIWAGAQFFRGKWGDEDAGFYTCCLFMMSLSPFCYCLFWYNYLYDWPRHTSDDYTRASILALAIVALLTIAVIYITYLIMWSPEKTSLSIGDGDVLFANFCRRLVDNAELPSGNHPCLLQRFDENTQRSIREAAAHNYDQLNRDAILRELNKLLKDRELYQVKEFIVHKLDKDSEKTKEQLRLGEDVSEEDVQRLNRNMLEASAYITETHSRTKKINLAKRRWDSWQRTLKAGVSKAPFWNISFFFAIFLGITYLLGFSFAFHDKAMLNSKYKAPALFMQRSPLFNVGKYPPDETTAAEGKQSKDSQSGKAEEIDGNSDHLWPEYVFYFERPQKDSQSGATFQTAVAEPKLKEIFVDKENHDNAVEELNGGVTDPNRRLALQAARLDGNRLKILNSNLSNNYKDWKKWINYERLERLVKAIELEDEAHHGEGIQIQLEGRADEKPYENGEKPGVGYPSNYALSEARAEAVKYELLKRLARHGKLGSNFQWIIIPLSNEKSSIAPPKEDIEAANKKGNPSLEARIASLETRKEIVGNEYSQFLTTKKSDLETLRKKYESLAEKRDRLEELVAKAEAFSKLAATPRATTQEAQNAQKESLEQSKTNLEESLDAFKYEDIEKDASNRVAVVRVRPLQGSKTHLYAPLSLMDYMYFTIYTITTTGYGDIVPTTTYAKFLCSVANILEVFFFVVFFNALLSLRADKQEKPTGENTEASVSRQSTRPEGETTRVIEQTNGNLDRALSEDIVKLKSDVSEIKEMLASSPFNKVKSWFRR